MKRASYPWIIFLLIGIGVFLFLVLRPRQEATVFPPAVQVPLTTPSSTTYEESISALPSATFDEGVISCSKNSALALRYVCLQVGARLHRDPAYCEIIGGAEERDDCYLGLLLSGNKGYCSKILNPKNQALCAALEKS